MDAVCARVQRCSPICNAFLDWRTRETKCGWVGILGLGTRVGGGPGTGVGGVAAMVDGDCTVLVGEWTGSGEDMAGVYEEWIVLPEGLVISIFGTGARSSASFIDYVLLSFILLCNLIILCT